MNPNYIELAKHLDKIGKYKQADNVDGFVKKAQFTYAPGQVGATGPKMQYSNPFDYMSSARMTAPSYGQELGEGSSNIFNQGIVSYRPLSFKEMEEFSKTVQGQQYIYAYNKGLSEMYLDNAAKTGGTSVITQMVGIINSILSSYPNPQDKAQMFHDNQAPILLTILKDSIAHQDIQTIKSNITQIQSLNLPEINTTLIPGAFQEAMQSLYFSSSAEDTAKYNQILSDSQLKPYTSGFSPK